jgi:hypothetical protein
MAAEHFGLIKKWQICLCDSMEVAVRGIKLIAIGVNG